MEIKKLEKADFETGVLFEQRLSEAHSAFAAMNQAYLTHLEILRQKYDAPAGLWALKDWATGFVTEDNNGK